MCCDARNSLGEEAERRPALGPPLPWNPLCVSPPAPENPPLTVAPGAQESFGPENTFFSTNPQRPASHTVVALIKRHTLAAAQTQQCPRHARKRASTGRQKDPSCLASIKLTRDDSREGQRIVTSKLARTQVELKVKISKENASPKRI